MAEHDPNQDGPLKVSDRRHFTTSGERRTDVDASAFEPAPPAPPAGPAAQAEPEPAKEKEKKPAPPAHPRLAAREINFLGLIQDLYATGLMQLGAELQPGQPAQLDLEGARETIDLLGMLQQKTHGNLDEREERMLASALYELRLGYVEVQRAATAPLPPPPRRK